MTVRLEGVDPDHLAWMLTALDQRIDVTPEETEYLLYRDYQARAQLRFAAGAAVDEVAHDLLWAARCLRFKEDLHLLKVPVERFRTRRIDPLELGASSGDELLGRHLGERYALALSTVLAGMADDATWREVRTVTRCFDGPARDDLDLAGMGALCWSAALAATLRGFDAEAALAAGLFVRARADAPDDVDQDSAGPLARYVRLFDLLEALRRGDVAALGAGVGVLVSGQLAQVRAGLTDAEWARPAQAPRYVDLAAVALATLARRGGLALDPGVLPAEARPFGEVLCGSS